MISFSVVSRPPLALSFPLDVEIFFARPPLRITRATYRVTKTYIVGKRLDFPDRHRLAPDRGEASGERDRFYTRGALKYALPIREGGVVFFGKALRACTLVSRKKNLIVAGIGFQSPVSNSYTKDHQTPCIYIGIWGFFEQGVSSSNRIIVIFARGGNTSVMQIYLVLLLRGTRNRCEIKIDLS